MKKEQLFKKELASAICMDFNGQLKALGGYVDVAPPEYIGEKLMFVNMEIARRILEHRTLNDFREQALTLLKKGGMISLCIYSGGDSGFEERDQILDWLKNLDSHQYLVIKSDYYNRPNNPPIPVLVIKN